MALSTKQTGPIDTRADRPAQLSVATLNAAERTRMGGIVQTVVKILNVAAGRRSFCRWMRGPERTDAEMAELRVLHRLTFQFTGRQSWPAWTQQLLEKQWVVCPATENWKLSRGLRLSPARLSPRNFYVDESVKLDVNTGLVCELQDLVDGRKKKVRLAHLISQGFK